MALKANDRVQTEARSLELHLEFFLGWQGYENFIYLVFSQVYEEGAGSKVEQLAHEQAV